MEEVDPDPEPGAADATGAAASADAVAAVLTTVPSLTPAEIKTVARVVGAGVAATAPALPAAADAVAAVEPEPAPKVAEKAAACWLKPDAAAALAFGDESPKPQPPLVSSAITDPEHVPAKLGPKAQQPEAHSESEAQGSGMDLSWARVRVVRERRRVTDDETCMVVGWLEVLVYVEIEELNEWNACDQRDGLV